MSPPAAGRRLAQYAPNLALSCGQAIVIIVYKIDRKYFLVYVASQLTQRLY
jgi:hypothetical protein